LEVTTLGSVHYGIRMFAANVQADGLTVIGGPTPEAPAVIASDPRAPPPVRGSIPAAPGAAPHRATTPTSPPPVHRPRSAPHPDLTHEPPFGPASVTSGNGDLNMAPGFVSPTDFHLAAGSPLINAGDPAAAGGVDLDGAPRIAGGRRDMGAYKFQPSPTTPGG